MSTEASDLEYCDSLDNNSASLRLMSQIIVLLSLCGTLFVILTYTCWRETRNFAFKLVLQISISDFIYCIAHFFSNNEYLDIPIDSGTLCTIQGFLVNFGMVSSFMWAMVIAWTLFATVVLIKPEVQSKFWIYCIYGYAIPLLTSIIPLITDNYGPVGYRCWISLENNLTKGKVLRFVLFYIPLWIVVVFNSISYYKVIKSLKQYAVGKPEKRFIRRLRVYPLILIVCYLCLSIHNIIILFTCQKNLNAFDYISVALADLVGFGNALVYGLNHHIQDIFIKKFPCFLIFRRCCGCCLCCVWAKENHQILPTDHGEYKNDSLISSLNELELSYFSNKHLDSR